MTQVEKLLKAYEIDVEYPDVSGIEHLDMLLTRSEIADVEADLTEAQRNRLHQADKRLIEQAQQFDAAIQSIASLDSWR